MSTIQCNIVSPEGELFSGPVELLSAEGGAGEIAITPRHAPLLTNLKPGPVKLVLEGGEEEIFFASGGFLEVQPGEVTLLTDVAERADDIDSAAAERAKELAERVVEVCESGEANFQPLYKDELPLLDKIKCVATEIYRASDISADIKIINQLKDWEKAGYGNLPVCMAKTQYSFSADPKLLGAPDGHVIPIREVRLSAGAGFIVAICGDIMTMPGLPSVPAAEKIHID